MVVPSIDELCESGELDPSDELSITKTVGLEHKYSPTALFLCTDQCFGYCRYCFRRRLRYKKDSSNEVARDFKAQVEYIREHAEIDNVLLSGGDPLMLPNEILDGLLGDLLSIEHVKMVRIGTKAPVFLPQRFTTDPEIISILKKYSSPESRLYIVTHFNHPREITGESSDAIRLLNDAGVFVMNQSVMLRDVNDEPDTLAELFNRLAYIGVRPYYVFQCRPVKNSTHFQLELAESYRILKEARRKMSGLAKTARLIMSHSSGKIEILALRNGKMHFKYHQAKDPIDHGRFFSLDYQKGAKWLDDLLPKSA